jgi:hypothetical protein
LIYILRAGVGWRFSGRSPVVGAAPRTSERWSQREQWMCWLFLNNRRIHQVRAMRRVKSEPQSGHVRITSPSNKLMRGW